VNCSLRDPEIKKHSAACLHAGVIDNEKRRERQDQRTRLGVIRRPY